MKQLEIKSVQMLLWSNAVLYETGIFATMHDPTTIQQQQN